MIRLSAVPGPLTEAMYYVLLALLREPAHGYALMARIQEISRQRLTVGPGTLYGVLNQLQKSRLIVLDDDDGRRKTYRLTARGRAALRQEFTRLAAMIEDGSNLLQGGDAAWRE